MKLIQALGVIALFLITTSGTCKKDSDPATTAKPEDLILGEWKITADYTDKPVDPSGTGQFTTDMYAYGDSCRNDNIMVIQSGGNLKVKEGLTKCDPGDPDIVKYGSWQMNYPTLTMFYITHTILQLDSSKLIMTFPDTIGGVAVIETAELQRQ